ncbi:MAG: preprotein translocase subunit SecA, partial [Prevotella sp.]|nr:preprotein translocase subunit SecA [Prevotella sp.]
MNFNKILQSLFGNKSTRDMKLIQPLVEKVKEAYPAIKALSNDELRAKTKEIQKYVQDSANEQKQKIADLKSKIEETPIDEREGIFSEIDKLEKEALEIYEKALNEVMPIAFSIVKDTARRFAENEETVVTATDFDRQLAANPKNDFIYIDGDKAVYRNHWTAGGNDLKWEMVHYDVQIFGGIALHQGKIAEMATGEGKTLVATLPVFLNALTGNGVHVVTVNDYLAKRDSEWMGPLYMFNGLSVDCIDKHRPNSPERRRAYMADITFGTNNEFGFDYLRDNMAHSPADLVQRAHNYAIVDEVDSVLIDDARTPLIISGPVEKGDDQMFEQYQPLVERLVEVQRKLASQYLAEAKQKISEGTEKNDSKLVDEGFLALYRSHKALPKNKPLIKFLSEDGIKAGMLKTEEYYMENNNRRMPECVEPLYFVVDEKQNSCDLTDKGTEWLSNQVNDKNLFVLPDIATELSELETVTTLSEQEKIDKKDDMLNHYAVQSDRVHTLQQLLKAYTMFNKDDEYVVMDGEVKIVDEQTGRIMEGRRWSDGLHQAVEAKEHVKVEAATQTFATITLQNYFRMYHKLSGMTGTASTEAGEFWDIYKLDVVEIPTNKPILRVDMDDRVYKTAREKYAAVIEEIEAMRNSGRPVLVGTTSVEISELLSRMLKLRNIPHQVLNAKYHQKEAEIVAEAGRSAMGRVTITDEDGNKHVEERMLGAVTIATNMAGRGTDIKLSPEVKAAGGLAIIGTERHESRRVDRQLRGRAGRQGDPGSSVFYVSLEDKLMRLFASERIARVMDKLGFKDGERIESPMISKSIERAQKKVEENNFGIRKHLLEYDDVMNKQRTFIYTLRHHALIGERIGIDISNMIFDAVENLVDNYSEAADYDDLKMELMKILTIEPSFTKEEYASMDKQTRTETLHALAMEALDRKSQRIKEIVMPVVRESVEGGETGVRAVPITDGKRIFRILFDLEEAVRTEGGSLVKEWQQKLLLNSIDELWKEHLRDLDELRQNVRNASYEQKDPLVIYKVESFHMFERMLNDLNTRVASSLERGQVYVRQAPPQQAGEEVAAQQQASRPQPEMSRAMPQPRSQQDYKVSKATLPSEAEAAQRAAAAAPRGAQQKTMPVKAA